MGIALFLLNNAKGEKALFVHLFILVLSIFNLKLGSWSCFILAFSFWGLSWSSRYKTMHFPFSALRHAHCSWGIRHIAVSLFSTLSIAPAGKCMEVEEKMYGIICYEDKCYKKEKHPTKAF